MNSPSLLQLAWIRVKEHAAPVIAAVLIYGGIFQVISVLRYPLANGVVQLANVIIRKGFPDHLLLAEYGSIPWLFHAKFGALGAMLIAVGILVGLWVNARSQPSTR